MPARARLAALVSAGAILASCSSSPAPTPAAVSTSAPMSQPSSSGAGGSTTTLTQPQGADPNSPTATSDPNPPSVAVPMSSTSPPPPDPNVVGPAAAPSSSPLLGAVVSTWTSMSWTLYSHQDRENATTGHYQFDCVGATNYFLSVADPQANNALRSAEHIGNGYVPSPKAVSSFFSSLPAGGNSLWTPVLQVSQIQGGDVMVIPPAPGSNEPGHALIAAGPALALSDGTYALLVYDSTAMPAHGPSDTRTWDTRDQPLQPGNRASGLGRGTVQLSVQAGGAPDHLYWSVGGHVYGGVFQVARPLA